MLNPIMGRLWTTAAPTTFSSLSADTVNAALFNNTTTPDKTAAVASTGFNTGVWVTANEVTDATNWTVRRPGARIEGVQHRHRLQQSICFQAAATAGAGNVTIANAYGCLVYDDTITGGTVAKQAMCYNSFGGSAQGVTGGTFTILWATVGALTNVVVFNVTV